MIPKKLTKVILAAFALMPAGVYAQDAYTMKMLPQLQQSQWVNASNQSDAKLSIGLPVLSGISFYVYNSGFSYNSIFQRVNDSTMAIRPGDFIDKLKEKNVISFGANINILSATYAVSEDLQIGFSVNERVDMRFTYPKDLFRFAWYGNGAFIGQSLNIGNFGLNASWYREYALHGTKSIGKWTFGASPKLLFGKANINTRESYLQLYTAPDYYELTAMSELNVQTSGFNDSTDRATGNDNAGDLVMNTKNVGLAIDLGASYKLNEKIELAAGINNLGYINWKNKINNYTTDKSSFTFQGFSLDQFLSSGDSNFISTDQYIDSVEKLIDYKENSNSYRTNLPIELFAMGTYNLTDKHHFVGQLNAQRFTKKFVLATTLGYRFDLNKHLTAALSYTWKSNSFFNVGGALIVRFAGMQWYMATDNWWASIKPLAARNANIHMGVNLAFGDRSKKKNNEDRTRIDEPYLMGIPMLNNEVIPEKESMEDEEGKTGRPE